MVTKQKQSDQLTGIEAHWALDEAPRAGGLKLQPMIRDNQPVDEPWVINNLLSHREKGLLEIRLQGNPEQLTLLASRRLFVLYIKYRNQLHESDALEVIRVQPGNESLTLFLEIPKQFSKVYHREFFRVHFETGLHVLIRMQLPQGVISGQLLDLSAGGCRAGIGFQAALQLVRPLPDLLSVTLEFPSGEQVSTSARLAYLQPDSAFSQALVGWHFVHQDSDSERKFFHYTLEAERELSRIKHPGKENLRKSKLFEPAPKVKAPPAKGSWRQAFRFVDPRCLGELLEIADLLAAQVLLLSARKEFHAEKMSELANRFMKLLDEDPSALQLILEQPQRKIHPVLLHTFRVAARCFPLLFKIGLTRRYELPALVSLLLHDLGKFFLGHQPCFNPLKESVDSLRKLKIQQIQLLRSASQLKWIPKDLGESLMVNANERLDGSGYPRSLDGSRLDTLARLISVSKVLDCLVHGYKDPARSWQEAYHWVYQKSQWFDKNALNTFVTTHGLRPVGSHLHFQSGELGLVTGVSSQGVLEEVMVIEKMDSQGQLLAGYAVSGSELQALGNPVKEQARSEFNPRPLPPGL